MEAIKGILLKNRPSLSVNSLKTYTSLLINLQKKISPKSDLSLKFFTGSEDKILDHVKSLEKESSKKTILSAYFVLTGKAKNT